MCIASLRAVDRASTYIVECIVGSTIAVIVLGGGTVANAGERRARAGAKRTVRALLSAALAGADLSVGPARATLSIDASTTLVWDTVAIAVIARVTRVLR